MKINKLVFKSQQWIIVEEKIPISDTVDILFVFGDIDILKKHHHTSLLQKIYPTASIVGCSTAGNILDTTVNAYEAVATAISFDKAYVKVLATNLMQDDIYHNTKTVTNSLEKENLKHLFLLAPGLINASEVINGLNLPNNVTVSGGLAGDDYKFENTYLFTDKIAGESILIVVGFYGDSLHTSIGCNTGWNEFGATRIVTKAKKNIIYEIDNKPAIELFKKYLGDKISDLPNSAIRFPLNIKENINDKNHIVLVMMDINSDGSFLFGGDIKEGSIVKLMRTNVSNLLEGAAYSAKEIIHYNDKTSLSLTLSCSARKIVLKQFAQEEIEIVKNFLPSNTQIVGFYSYGEIAPFSSNLFKPLLHNQTMTITTIYED